MNHVIEDLGRLRTRTATDQTVPDDVVRRDLARGRAALTRRRARRAVTGLGATAAAAVLTVSVISAGSTSDPRPRGGSGVDLVAYTGAQLPGFTVAKVPEGFVLQGANEYSLDIARPDDHSSLDDYQGKLVVMLQSRDATGTPTGTHVEISGRPGTISTYDPTAKQLFYSDGTHDIVVQAPTGLGLSDAELVEFASGVTVTTEAVAGVG
ncbi:hypothetical protein [Nocardioides pocheonensis]|uniref:Uncharacterized protein n=1 Tax=Nocardioides pocheonensis TaxID=661485 RepID=A0A3N0GHD0_9ACTN|nr:hypothetical protein [Nocardioides pocheonensis]RNM11884.1 hypothetical protein EFL26_22385 [Nocardioides pocheonensis]